MSAIIRELKDKDGNICYPVSKAEAVYIGNGHDTVGRMLGDMQDMNTEITFPTNQIREELASGNVKLATFYSDHVVETITNSEDEVVSTKTTTFNADGSISIVVS